MYMFIKNPILALSGATMIIAAAMQASGGSIGVKYVRSDALAATDTAGAGSYAQVNWNMAVASVGGSQGTPVTPLNALKDNTGTATAAALTSWTQSTINSWSLGDTGSPNAKLLNSFSDRQPTISFTGLGSTFPGGYSVVVCYSNNEGPSVSTLTLTGSVNDLATRSIRTGAMPHADAAGYHAPERRRIHPLCRLYKVNYLHPHFNDDQAYTFPSAAYRDIHQCHRCGHRTGVEFHHLRHGFQPGQHRLAL